QSLAKIYAESSASKEEVPELEEGFKIALFLCRHFQDPMAEIVKLDPRQFCGINYTKEIEKSLFDESIDWNIRSCVNFVGVDLNTASHSLLRYVSGLNDEISANIIEYRKKLEDEIFASRKDLMKVSGISKKIYEQCAGFLRIKNGIHPLDATFIHPESYHIVSRIADKFKCRIQDLLENPKVLSKINYSQFTTKNVGFPTIRDIIYELGNPYKDLRIELQNIPIQQNVKSYKSLSIGSILFGKVTKITKIGVFMDIGVDIDGFVHISEISANYVKDPASLLSYGDTIKVKIISLDLQKKRISLSIKKAQDSLK
ncbi:helix-hairpin-helix domain-containing protein, partial [bacterium]|nr:helix-hairpin-helix domain-containing protein [bacterium]